jgi:hypothetical protein
MKCKAPITARFQPDGTIQVQKPEVICRDMRGRRVPPLLDNAGASHFIN